MEQDRPRAASPAPGATMDAVVTGLCRDMVASRLDEPAAVAQLMARVEGLGADDAKACLQVPFRRRRDARVFLALFVAEVAFGAAIVAYCIASGNPWLSVLGMVTIVVGVMGIARNWPKATLLRREQ